MSSLARFTGFSLAFCLAGMVGCVSTAPTTTGYFLREMVDLNRLADVDAHAYKTVQFSSYDHRSNLPGGPNWFGNSDGFGGDKIPNFEAVLKETDAEGSGEYLICDVEGPGVVVRTWTAAIDGDIRVVLDNAKEPLYEGPAAAFLSCPYRVLAEAAGIDPGQLEGTFQQMQAAYCPIPFAKRCRVVWIGKIKQVHFYQIQVRLYERGIRLKTFAPADLKTYEAELNRVERILAAPNGECALSSKKPPAKISATVYPGCRVEVVALEGPAAIERLTLKLAAEDMDRALRQTILHVICDEYPWGQVQAPVGDFFGAAPGINPFDALPLTVLPDGTMVCRYIMPFERSLKIAIENLGEQVVTVSGDAVPMDYEWNDDTSMYFQACWRVDHGLMADPHAVQDLPFIVAHGGGRYVGTAVMMLNPCGTPTPYGGWWGEGDEKIFVDEDRVPSTFGTGSEDYFNYAWSVPDIFGYAYCGQPRDDGPGNRGFVTNQRWHIIDDLPFKEFLAFYMELYPHTPVPDFSYARIGYHYARPGVIDDHVAITGEDVRHLELPPDWKPTATHGMHGAVYFEAEDLVQPGPTVTQVEGNLWAGSELMLWRPSEVGEQLTLRVSIPETARFRICLGLKLDNTSGLVSALLDGEPINFGGRMEPVDLYKQYRKLLRQYNTDVMEMSAGYHDLTLVFKGAAEDLDGPTIGIDYVALQKR